MVSGGLIAQALEGYEAETQVGSVEAAGAQRAEVLELFPSGGWPEMPLERYALGQSEHPDTYCRWMEFKATDLGSIKGGSARKHHIYHRAEGGWWFESDRYDSVEEAWLAVRQGFVEAIALAEAGDWEPIDSLPALRGGPALLAKTLHLYFPDEVLPICSHAHLSHFLRALGDGQGSLDELGTVALNRRLLAGLRASGQLAGWSTKEMERLLYTSEFSPASEAPQGPIPDVAGFIAAVIAEYGDEAIETRRGAEDKARDLLDETVGTMGEEQLRAMLRLFNADAHQGKQYQTRFSPAFVGATADGLAANLDAVNEWSERIWQSDESGLATALGELLADHKLLPFAGTSFPSMLSYLRSAERFAVWLQPTDRGLQRLRPGYQPLSSPGAGKLEDYLEFCAAATQLMRDYDVPPELLDAVLAAAARAEIDENDGTGEPPPTGQVWLFQANPKIYDVDAAVSEEPTLSWTVRQYRRRIGEGDRVYIWRAGPEAGVIATATVLDEPTERAESADSPYVLEPEALTKPEPRVRLAIDEVLAEPILRADLLDHPVLKNLAVIVQANATNFEVTPAQDAALREILEPARLVVPPVQTELAAQLYLPSSFLREIVEMLVEKGQAIFYGPPGTGKTRIALDIAQGLTRDGGGFEIVQFHPSYSYEDFVGGFRPLEEDSATGVRYTRQNGPLRRIAERAEADSQHPYVLVVDEINRGNIPKIFGELLFLLEYRRRSVRLQYWPEAEFSLPETLFLIGTMNTADRSIALVDTALRRRFYFVEFTPLRPPVDQVLRRWLEAHGQSDEAALLLDRLNQLIGEEEFAIGPSYFISRDGTPPDLERIWKREIMPLLQEHYFGVSWEQARFSLAGLRAELAPPPQEQPADDDAGA